MSRTVLHARWIVPVSAKPVENGRVIVEDGQIAAVERAGSPGPGVVDFGDAVILPGFVNAHTHLELTCCHGRVPFDRSFTGWVEALTSRLAGTPGPVALALDNSQDWLAADIALGASGHVNVPVPPWFTPAQIAHLVEAAGLSAWLGARPPPVPHSTTG